MKVEAETSAETLLLLYTLLHDAPTQDIGVFISTTVRASNITQLVRCHPLSSVSTARHSGSALGGNCVVTKYAKAVPGWQNRMLS
jgi:hypothetical protein